jgi:hypothetical protein
MELIEQINAILDEFKAAGYTLTVRQTYYQLVAKAIIENTEKSYDNIQNLINVGRQAGLIDWNMIEDRTREFHKLPSWETPASIIRSAAQQYHHDLWVDQKKYVEVWIEKEALIGIVEQAADHLDCPCFSCRGYDSQSEMWGAAMRFIDKAEQGKDCSIIYLGDHDPSGIDMARDIKDRLTRFRADIAIDRIALTMKQIEEYNPPPNYVKIDPKTKKYKDTRAKKYVAQYGMESWELDALRPETLNQLITKAIKSRLDQKLFDKAIKRQERERKEIFDLLETA